MIRNPIPLGAALMFVLAVGCNNEPSSHGHAHGDERPTIAVSNWTERSELFMEYPLFQSGQSGRAAIHVTDLRDFSPLSEGRAIVVLRGADGRELEFSDGPSRPGIFGVDMRVDAPGTYQMSLRIDAPGLQDLHELGAVKVHPQGVTPEMEDEEEGISFLKEQQWNLDFGTTLAGLRPLRSSLVVSAVVQPRIGGDVTLTAPVSGRVDLRTEVPLPGTRLRAGTLLARIVPGSDDLRDGPALQADFVAAEQGHLLAQRELERVERLVAGRALPARRLEEAKAGTVSSLANLDAARKRVQRYESLSGDGEPGDAAFAIRAPFDGVVSSIRFAPGATVEHNQVLLRLVDPDRVHIVGAVPESHSGALASLAGAEMFRDGHAAVSLQSPLTIDRVIEPVSRTSEVRFAFDNRDARLQIGQSVGLRLFVGESEELTAVPETAVVQDAAGLVVFVQTGGESFERRNVRLGRRTEGWVHVVEGLQPGERVVDRGAYLIRLASMSDEAPAHGHVH